MASSFSYACRDYPGMEGCPGQFTAGTRDELWQLVELHARVAHGEDPSAWSEDEKTVLEKLIRTAAGS